jgi:hypothetical protein
MQATVGAAPTPTCCRITAGPPCICLCSFCLGLPYVAWVAALQRQRVMAKHGVAVTDEEAWATACYPCSLLQMHTLLQQQQYHCTASHHQQQQASVPLRAPKLQQMKGECVRSGPGSFWQPAAMQAHPVVHTSLPSCQQSSRCFQQCTALASTAEHVHSETVTPALLPAIHCLLFTACKSCMNCCSMHIRGTLPGQQPGRAPHQCHDDIKGAAHCAGPLGAAQRECSDPGWPTGQQAARPAWQPGQ